MSQFTSPPSGRSDRLLSSFQIARSASYKEGRPHQQTRLSPFDGATAAVLAARLKDYRNWNGHSYAERHLEEWVSRCPEAVCPSRLVHVLASQNYGRLGEGEEAIDLLLLDDLCQFHVLELKARRVAGNRGVTPDEVQGQMNRYVEFLRKELPDFPVSLSTYYLQFTEAFTGSPQDLDAYFQRNYGKPYVHICPPVLCRTFLTEGYDDYAVEFFRARQQQEDGPIRLIYYRFYPDPDRDSRTGCKDRIEFWEVALFDNVDPARNAVNRAVQEAADNAGPGIAPLPLSLQPEEAAPCPPPSDGLLPDGRQVSVLEPRPEPVCRPPSTDGSTGLDAATYVLGRQVLWARRHGIAVHGSAGDRGRPAYTPTLEENLFEPLTEEARRDYEQGQGQELRQNMRAVHSSSALACNLFHYWKSRGLPAPVAAACGLPAENAVSIQFEPRLPIADDLDRTAFPYDPNPDAEFLYTTGQKVRAAAVECKLGEPYDQRGHAGIKRAYLVQPNIWDGLPHCRDLATRLSPDDTEFNHLHAAQLLKHLLGLKHAYGLGGFILAYLWYDVPGGEGWRHRQEVERFADIVGRDGIDLRAVTYQEVFLRLARQHRDGHAGYVDYLAERYL